MAKLTQLACLVRSLKMVCLKHGGKQAGFDAEILHAQRLACIIKTYT